MFRRLGLALVVGLSILIPVTAAQPGAAAAGASVTSRKAGPWRPAAGAAFNNPVGGPAQRANLMHRLGLAIRHTHKGQTIRIATYSFDRKDIANLLIKAHHRGVHVQMVVNDNWTSAATKHLRHVLGHNPHKRHFVVICEGSCRGGPGNLHMKVFSFTKTGGASDVLMTGSTNPTSRAVSLQWNDLFTEVGNKDLFSTFVGVFNQLKLDKKVTPRWVEYNGSGMDATFYRKSAQQRSSVQSQPAMKAPAPEDDPVNQRLKRIRCKAVKGAGINGHTVVRIMMYAWQNDRGKYLADRVASMARHGCVVKAVLSRSGRGVRKILAAANIPMRSADWQYNDEGKVNFYSHLKVLAVNGTYARKPTHSVWTGSENWSRMSFRNDEMILHIASTQTYRQYRAEFNYLWKNETHPMDVHPTTKPPR